MLLTLCLAMPLFPAPAQAFPAVQKFGAYSTHLFGQFANTGSMPHRYTTHASARTGANVLVFGGYSTGAASLFTAASGTWGSAGSTNHIRYDSPTATTLADGTSVLVAGGWNNTEYFVAPTEVYASGVFTAAGDMITPRNNHTATLLPDGRVLVAGGYNGTYLQNVEIYDPGSRSWSNAAPMTIARAYHTATLINGKVLVTGGFNPNHWYLASCELYDPATNSWTTVGDLAEARGSHAAAVVNNGGNISNANYPILYKESVVVFGGLIDTNTITNTAEIFDTVSGTWSSAGNLSAARAGHTATVLANNTILITGGKGSKVIDDTITDPDPTHAASNALRPPYAPYHVVNSTYLNTADLYDPTTTTWSANKTWEGLYGAAFTPITFTDARYLHTATLLADGKVLLAGGQINDTPTAVNTAFLFTPSNRLNVRLSDIYSALNGRGTVSSAAAPADTYNPNPMACTTHIGQDHNAIFEGNLGHNLPINDVNAGFCVKAFDLNTVVTLTATADTDHAFIGWVYPGCTGTTGTCPVTMTQVQDVLATFKPQWPTLNITSVNGQVAYATAHTGSGTCNNGSNCSPTFQVTTDTAVSNATLTATPHVTVLTNGMHPISHTVVPFTFNDFAFNKWTDLSADCKLSHSCSGNNNVTNNIITINMDDPKDVIANFDRVTKVLTVNVIGGGLVSSASIPDFTTPVYSGSASLNLALSANGAMAATADACSKFNSGWTGDCRLDVSGGTPPYNTCILDSMVSPVNIPSDSADCTAANTPYTCCTGLHVGCNDNTMCTSANVPFACCTAAGAGTCPLAKGVNKTVTATFLADTKTLVIERTGAGTGTITSAPKANPAGSGSAGGSSVSPVVNGTDFACTSTTCTREIAKCVTNTTLTASTTDTNSTFTGWSGDCTGTTPCVIDMTTGTYPKHVTANFSLSFVAPTNITATAGTAPGSVNVAWTGSNVSGTIYVLEQSVGDGPWTQVYSGATPSKSFTNLGGGFYRYQVKATAVMESGPVTSGYCGPTTALLVDYPAVATPTITATSTPQIVGGIGSITNSTTGVIKVVWSTTTAGAFYALEQTVNGGTDWTTVYTGTNTTYTTAELANGTNIRFRVKADKLNYTESAYAYSGTISVLVSLAQPATLIVPTSLITTNSFVVSWTNTNTITGLTFVLEESKHDWDHYTEIYRGSNLRFTVPVDANDNYYFRVKAIKNDALNGYLETVWTYPVDTVPGIHTYTTVVLALTPPLAISVPAVSATGSVKVTWSNANIPGATFILERSPSPYTTWTEVARGAINTFTDTIAASGSYKYRVKATMLDYTPVTTSAPLVGDQVCAVTLTLAPPTTFTVPASTTTGSFNVSWSPVPHATGYVLEQYDGSTWTTVDPATGETTASTTRAITLTILGTYGYRVHATATGYTDSNTQGGVATTCTYYNIFIGTPGSVTNSDGATSSDGAFNITWTAAPNATAYTLEQFNGSTWTTLSTNAVSPYAVQITSAQGNHIYTYRVTGTRPGYGSGASVGTPPCNVMMGVLPAPTAVLTSVNNYNGDITVSWTPPIVSGVTYTLQESTNGGGTWTTIPTGTPYVAPTTPYVAPHTVNGSYTYQVMASKAGYLDSVYSASSAAAVLTLAIQNAPATPTVASTINGRINVSWTYSGSPAASNGYEILVSTGGAFAHLAYVGAGVLTYEHNLTNPGASVDFSYQYKVIARKIGWIDSPASPASTSFPLVLTSYSPASITVPVSQSLEDKYTVRWTAPATSNDTNTLHYRLQESRDGGTSWHDVTIANDQSDTNCDNTTALSCVIKPHFLTGDTQHYQYKVTTRDNSPDNHYTESPATVGGNDCVTTWAIPTPTVRAQYGAHTVSWFAVTVPSNNAVTYEVQDSSDSFVTPNVLDANTSALVSSASTATGDKKVRVKARAHGYPDSAWGLAEGGVVLW
jgi:hypothetical protein